LNNITQNTQELKNQKNHKTNEFYIKSGKGTVKIVEHFIGTQTYNDVIKAALRREFGEYNR
jgi:hypothetical protein